MAHFSEALTKQNGTALTRSHTRLSHFFNDLADLLAGLDPWPEALRLRDTVDSGTFPVLVAWPEGVGREVGGDAVTTDGDGFDWTEVDCGLGLDDTDIFDEIFLTI